MGNKLDTLNEKWQTFLRVCQSFLYMRVYTICQICQSTAVAFLRYIESYTIGNGMYRSICQSLEPSALDQTHAQMEQPSVIEIRHDMNVSHFEQLLLSPVVKFHSVPAIGIHSYRQHHGFL
jgi:hypothetical protein